MMAQRAFLHFPVVPRLRSFALIALALIFWLPSPADATQTLVQHVSAGNSHSCALTVAGAVMCWGNNSNGQLGNGTTTDSVEPVRVYSLSNGVTAIAAGGFHTCALTVSGDVLCWGSNESGQLGDGSSVAQTETPRQVVGLNNVLAIAAGHHHTCAVTRSGDVKCWGNNKTGQLGDSTEINRFTPVAVAGLGGNTVAVAAGGLHTCALISDGVVKCWGENNSGQLGDGTKIPRSAPEAVVKLGEVATTITAGEAHTCALTNLGTLFCWGRNAEGQLGENTINDSATPLVVSALSGAVTAIAAGSRHNCALNREGGVLCWGANLSGQLGSPTIVNRSSPDFVFSAERGVTALAAGESHTCIVTETGRAACWGSSRAGQLGNNAEPAQITPVTVIGLHGAIRTVVAGGSHTCALVGMGAALKCWGGNFRGQVGDGTIIDRAMPVDVSDFVDTPSAPALGLNHTCAVTDSGGVKCWGENTNGQLGDGTTNDRLYAVGVSALSGSVTAVAAGANHTCALTSLGRIKCWGNNKFGQLGDGSTTTSLIPVDVSDITGDVVAISAGDNHTCARFRKGAIKCWGANDVGQLGDGTTFNRSVPVEVGGLGETSILTAGSNHTCAVDAKGTKCWGSNSAGQLGDGTTRDNALPTDVVGLGPDVVALAAGGLHTCAITEKALQCWGSNRTGQLGDGSFDDRLFPADVLVPAIKFVALGAGFSHTCALTAQRSVMCWGSNAVGQLGDGTIAARAVPLNIARLEQTISFEPTPNRIPYLGSIATSATATSGLPVEFVALTSSVCSVSSTGVITALAPAGSLCMIQTRQLGDASYLEAPPQVQTFLITRIMQVIQFFRLADRNLNERTITVSASGGASTSPVTFTSQTPTVCSNGGAHGNEVTLLTPGICHIRASQAGDDNFMQAADVDQSFAVRSPSNGNEQNQHWWRWRGGGCTINPNAELDWSFLVLLGLALGSRVRNRRRTARRDLQTH